MTSPWNALLQPLVDRPGEPVTRRDRIRRAARHRLPPAKRLQPRKVDEELKNSVLLPTTVAALAQASIEALRPAPPPTPCLRETVSKTPVDQLNPWNLSPRQLTILDMLVQGMRVTDIAARMALSVKTISHHLGAMRERMGVATNAQAVYAWMRHFKVHTPPPDADKDDTLMANLVKVTSDKTWSKR